MKVTILEVDTVNRTLRFDVELPGGEVRHNNVHLPTVEETLGDGTRYSRPVDFSRPDEITMFVANYANVNFRSSFQLPHPLEGSVVDI